MRYLNKITMIVIGLLLLVGCGSTTSIATSSPTATKTAVPTATPTIDPTKIAAICGEDFAKVGVMGRVGDLLVSTATSDFLSYPGIKLPDDIPQGKPYLVGKNISIVKSPPAGETAANPNSYSMFDISICNISATQAHEIDALGMKIAAFTPDTSSSINVMAGCTGVFSSTARQGGGSGCGGARGPANIFHAEWPDTVSVGTEANQMKQVESQYETSSSGYSNFPVTLSVGKKIDLVIGMIYPKQAGTFTFQFGVKSDKAAMVYADGTIAPVFLANNVQVWSGDTCYNHPYIDQIPSTGPEQFYLCPGKR
jgi:hypothetical protein